MSANDGGDPIRLSRAPVPKPHILRGDWAWIAREETDAIGDRITVEAEGVTYHHVEVVDLIGPTPVVRILPETVATWDVAPNPN